MLGVLVDPIVSQIGQYELRHSVDGDLEVDLHLRLDRMGCAERQLVAGFAAAQLLVHLGHDAAAAHLVQVVLCGQSGQRLAFDRTLDVDRGPITVIGRPVHLGDIGELSARLVDASLDLGIWRYRTGNLHLQGLVARDRHHRPDLDRCRERHGTFAAVKSEFELGLVHHVDLVVTHGLGVVARHRLFERLRATDF